MCIAHQRIKKETKDTPTHILNNKNTPTSQTNKQTNKQSITGHVRYPLEFTTCTLKQHMITCIHVHFMYIVHACLSIAADIVRCSECSESYQHSTRWPNTHTHTRFHLYIKLHGHIATATASLQDKHAAG